MRWSFDHLHGAHAGQFPVLPVDGPLSDLADVLEPEPAGAAPVVSSHEWAFADTVSLRMLPEDEPAPLSGPIIVHDPLGVTAEQQLVPRAFPPPAAAGGPLVARARDALQASIDEARELWAGTAEMVNARPGAITMFRRARAMWSFWEWGRTDILRASMIGVAVFLAAACVGASVFGAGTAEASSAAEARTARTADQHTGMRVVVRAKHTRR